MKHKIKYTALLWIFFFSMVAFPQTGNIVISVVGDTVNIGEIPYIIERGVIFLELKDFLDYFNAVYDVDNNLQKLNFNLEGSNVEVTAENPFVAFGEGTYQFPIDTRKYDDEIYVPADYFCRLLTKRLPGDYLFDLNEMKIDVDVGKAKLFDLKINEKINGTQITISSSRYFGNNLKAWISDTGYLLLTAYPAKVDSESFTIPERIGLIRNVVANNFSQSVQLNFDLVTKNLEDPELQQDIETNEINIYLYKRGRSTRNLIQSSESIIENEKNKWIIDKIVIDPGHGGRDPGAVGPTGLKEKDIVLDIALKLGDLIKNNLNVDVTYTRTSDRFVDLKERTRFANSENGKIFVSLHCNGNRNRRVNHFEMYFLSPAKENNAIDVMELENSVIKLEDSQDEYKDMNDVNLMIYTITQSGFIKESELLAEYLSLEMGKRITETNRGINQGVFYVLIGASMPNVLVEMPHISNRQNERKYKTSSYRESMAYSLFKGVEKFVNYFRN